MASITGVGGIFFRAKKPEALLRWYCEMLGVDMRQGVWFQQAGPTVFAPFPEKTDYFSRDSQQFMINFRVDDLDGMLEALRRHDVAIETREEWDGAHGRFARIWDPEGNPIELWEVPAETPEYQQS